MNADPDWSLYRTLLAVLDDGSLSGAARRLGLTQPTIARHVEALETALGSDLFLRSQRGLAPTELAQSLRPHAEAIAASAAALLRTASGTASEIIGTVRVSASEVIAVEHLPPILAALRRAHPHLVIELSATDRTDDLLLRKADIAVRNTDPMQKALLARRLPSIDLGLYARKDYLDRRGTPTSTADLSNHDLIGFDGETGLQSLRVYLPELQGHGVALRTDNNLAQLAAIRAGFGVGLCQAGIAGRDPALVRVLTDITFPLPLWVAMHEKLKTNARFLLVFDLLVKELRGIGFDKR